MDSFRYRVSDGLLDSSEAQVSLTVFNARPQSVKDEFSSSANTALSSANSVLANDIDGDHDNLTASLVESTTRGTLQLNADGTFVYTPEPQFSGTDTFTYRASDGAAVGDLTRVILRVDGSSISLGIDSDADGVPDSVENSGASQGDSNQDGVPDFNQPNVATFRDALTGDYQSLVSPPGTSLRGVASSHWLDTAKLPYWIQPSTGALDFEVHGVAPGSLVAVTLTSTTTFSDYFQHGPTPDNPSDHWYPFSMDPTTQTGATITGSVVTLKIQDGGRGDHDATADGVIRDPAIGGVATANAIPVVSHDSYRVHHNAVLAVSAEWGVLINDTPEPGETLAASLVSGPMHGTVSLSADGSFSYTPSSTYVGDDSFQYKAFDGVHYSTPATVNIRVWNGAPGAKPNYFKMHHDTALTVPVSQGMLANDWDNDGDSISVVSVTTPSNGTVSFNPNGSFTYVPSAGFVGTDSFSYVVSDSIATETSRVDIEIRNNDPVAGEDVYRLHHDTSLTVAAGKGILANDFDPDALDSITFTANTTGLQGTLSLSSNGSFSYTPPAGFVGTDTFTYTLSDGANPTSGYGMPGGGTTGTVSLEVWNNIPQSVSNSYQVEHGNIVSISLFASDWDGDSTLVTTSTPSHGTLTPLGGTTYAYHASPVYSGQDSFTYRIWDGAKFSESRTISINILNRKPVALDDYATYTVLPSASAYSLNVFANDYDLDPGVVASLGAFPTPEAAIFELVSGPQHGTLSIGMGGNVTYTPSTGFGPSLIYTGFDSFSYRRFDGISRSDVATVTINAKNSPPLGISDLNTIDHATSKTTGLAFSVATNDSDAEGGTLTYQKVSGPAWISVDAAGKVSGVAPTIPGTPPADTVGEVGFSYTISDGVTITGPISASVYITNRAPVARGENKSTPIDTPIGLSGISSNDSDSDGDPLDVYITRIPTHGKLSAGGVNMAEAGKASGALTYVPDSGYTGDDRFWYHVYDGAAFSAEVSVAISIWDHDRVAQEDRDEAVQSSSGFSIVRSASQGVLANDWHSAGLSMLAAVVGPTVIQGVSFALNSDGSYTVSSSDPNFEGDVEFQYRIVTAATNSMETPTAKLKVHVSKVTSQNTSHTLLHDRVVSGDVMAGDSTGLTRNPGRAHLVTNASNGTLYFYPDGGYTYRPNPGFVGADAFTYQISKGGTTLAELYTVDFEVTNAAVVAVDDAFEMSHSKVLTGNVALNDTDADASDGKSIQLTSGPLNGNLSLNPDGSFTYIPNWKWAGTDTFTYTASDGASSSAGTVTVNVLNDLPAVGGPRFTIQQGVARIPLAQ